MRVKAKKLGFYGKLRNPNEEFNIESKDQLGSWMEEVKQPAKPKAQAKPKA